MNKWFWFLAGMAVAFAIDRGIAEWIVARYEEAISS